MGADKDHKQETAFLMEIARMLALSFLVVALLAFILIYVHDMVGEKDLECTKTEKRESVSFAFIGKVIYPWFGIKDECVEWKKR